MRNNAAGSSGFCLMNESLEEFDHAHLSGVVLVHLAGENLHAAIDQAFKNILALRLEVVCELGVHLDEEVDDFGHDIGCLAFENEGPEHL